MTAPASYTIGKLAQVLSVNEQAVRKMLRDAGYAVDPNATNPDESIPYDTVVDLYAFRAGTREGRLLGMLLGKSAR